jgi:general stress protein 26
MNTTTAEQSPEALAKLKELVSAIDVAMVTTVTPDGALRSRPMATRDFDDAGSLWFFTSDVSGKAHDLEEERAVNVSYAEPGKQRYVSITGNASIVHDRTRAEALWHPAVETFFPAGIDDPHLALLCVRIETAEYWDAPSSKMMQVWSKGGGGLNGARPPAGEHTRVDIRATPTSG